MQPCGAHPGDLLQHEPGDARNQEHCQDQQAGKLLGSTHRHCSPSAAFRAWPRHPLEQAIKRWTRLVSSTAADKAEAAGMLPQLLSQSHTVDRRGWAPGALRSKICQAYSLCRQLIPACSLPAQVLLQMVAENNIGEPATLVLGPLPEWHGLLARRGCRCMHLVIGW